MLRKTGIFLLVTGLIVSVSIAGVAGYHMWDENRAAKAVEQVSRELTERIERNKRAAEEAAARAAAGEAAADTDPASGISDGDYQRIPEDATPLERITFQFGEGVAGSDSTDLIRINGESYIGILNIPSLSLVLPVNNEWSYSRLRDTPCRYSGSLSGSMVICAHDYRSHFGNIHSLSPGDRVTITDARGTAHEYRVELITLIDGTDISGMVNTPYDLTLFTCDADDDTKRLTVRCSRVE